MIILTKQQIHNSKLFNSHTKKAYLYSSEEEYLLSFMDKYSQTYNEEAEDKVILAAQNNAIDHFGENMAWYSKALLNNGVTVSLGEEVLIKSAETGEPITTHVLSINNNGLYLKEADSDNIYFGYISDSGALVYDPIDSDIKKEATSYISYYIIPQYNDRDLGYKEAVKSTNINTIEKRASYILKGLDKLFPEVKWSVRIINDVGEDVEVLE